MLFEIVVMAARYRFLLLWSFLLFEVFAIAQHSQPVARDSNMDALAKGNKFIQREATDDMKPLPQLNEENLANTECPQYMELRWQTEVGSSIYATPLINDINGDGKLEIVVPTFVHYLEVLEGSDGEKLSGWPAQHQFTAHASALLYDIDKDGNKEILLATFNGEVLFFRAGGFLSSDKLIVPRRRVRKDWFVGLDDDIVDRSKSDIHDESLVQDFTKHTAEKLFGTATNDTLAPTLNDSEVQFNEDGLQDLKVESQQNQDISAGGVNDMLTDSIAQSQESKRQRRILQVDSGTGDARHTEEKSATDLGVEAKTNDGEATPFVEDPEDKMEEEALASFDVFREEKENREEGLTEEYDYGYDDYVNEAMWGDEDWDELHHERTENFVEVDSHILSTPAIADIDNDGVDEMVIAVSYFFDHEYYDAKEHSQELGENLDLGKYVAGAIVVFNLQTKQVKWKYDLDLSTDSTSYRAYIYSPPTVVDLNGDGYLEIIVGTSMGYVYAISHRGDVLENFPLLMGEIQAQVVAADINDDGIIELVTTDAKGNVAAWTGEGNEIWEVHLKSLISQGPTVGDVDGDGHTDLVVPTTSGNIYVLKGSDGSYVGNFPFRTHGRVMSPALLVDLNRQNEKRGLTIAIGSFDGYFYLIDGPTGCAEAIDIGETSYSMALAENVDGGDDLDIIVTTMNGNVYCFQTLAPYHPLKAWPMQTQGRNVFASRYHRGGVYIVPSSRTFRDVAGESFHVTFEIVGQDLLQNGGLGPYRVTVTVLTPGNHRGDKRFAYHYTYSRPGVYTVTLPGLTTRAGGTVVLEMLDKNSLYFSDEFSLTFHMQYYRLLKWLHILPFLGMTAMFLVFRTQEDSPLPSFFI